MNLSAVRVFVRDLAAAENFYARSMGLRLTGGAPGLGYCVFHAGQANFIVECVPHDAPQEDQVLVGRFTGVSFEVPDIATTHRDLVARGVHFTGAPEPQSWGGVLATLRDPEGNELQIVQVKRAV